LLDKKAPQQVITQPDPDKFDQVYHIKGLLSKAECTRFIEAQEKEGYGFTNYNKKCANATISGTNVLLTTERALNDCPVVGPAISLSQSIQLQIAATFD
jgi:hypothetical protein